MNENIPNNENDNQKNKFNLKEILQDKRKKAGLTLGLYALFFIFVFIYMGSIGDNKATDNNNNNINDNNNINNNDPYIYGEISYSKYTPLMNNNYKYKVNYYINGEEKTFEGERKDDSYSVIPEEDYILEIKDLLNIDSIIDLVKKSELDYETKYSSGVVLQTYDVSINDFCEEYNIVLNDETSNNIVMKIYANRSYIDKIYFDITNLANVMDTTNITKYEIEVYFSNVNSIK